MEELSKISTSKYLTELSYTEVCELQRAFNLLGENLVIDGIVGEKTQAAWSKFKQKKFLSRLTEIGPSSVFLLKKDLEKIPQANFQPDFSTRQGTIEAIAHQCRALGLEMPSQIAYLLATVEHETNNTFQPVREAYWLSEDWRRRNLRYYPYYGRGYVQLTWEFNYRKYEVITGKPLVSQPDLALDPEIACFILVHGSKNGVFTGLKLENFVNSAKKDFVGARRVINGHDRTRHIAGLAGKWEKYLIDRSDAPS